MGKNMDAIIRAVKQGVVGSKDKDDKSDVVTLELLAQIADQLTRIADAMEARNKIGYVHQGAPERFEFLPGDVRPPLGFRQRMKKYLSATDK